MFLSFIQWHNCPHASGVLTHTGGLHSMWQPLISCVPASPPKYGRPSGTFGVAMTAGDVGAHATPQDSHLTFPPRWWRVGTGPWVRPSLRSVEWVYGSIIGCAPPLNIFPWHPPRTQPKYKLTDQLPAAPGQLLACQDSQKRITRPWNPPNTPSVALPGPGTELVGVQCEAIYMIRIKDSEKPTWH